MHRRQRVIPFHADLDLNMPADLRKEFKWTRPLSVVGFQGQLHITRISTLIDQQDIESSQLTKSFAEDRSATEAYMSSKSPSSELAQGIRRAFRFAAE